MSASRDKVAADGSLPARAPRSECGGTVANDRTPRKRLQDALGLVGICTLVACLSTPAAAAAPPPLTLERAVELALVNGEAIKIAGKGIEDARLQRRKALGAIAPDIALGGAWNYLRKTGGSDDGDSFGYTLTLNQPIYTGGRASSALRSADHGIRISELAAGLTREEIYLAATGAFLDALAAREVLAAVEQGRVQAREFLDLTRARFELGEVTRTALLRAELGLVQGDNQAVLARHALDLALDSLRTLTGTDVGDLSTDGLPPPGGRTACLDALVGQAIGARKELAMAGESVGIAREGIVSAKGKFLPFVYANGYYGKTDPDFFPTETEAWGGSLILAIPLYDRGFSLADLSLAKVALEKSELELAALRKRIDLEVRGAWYRLQGAESSLSGFEKQVALAEENLRGSRAQYEIGMATPLEVSTALSDLLSARVGLASATYERIAAALALQKAAGQLTLPAETR
jgi:outer membrane protein